MQHYVTERYRVPVTTGRSTRDRPRGSLRLVRSLLILSLEVGVLIALVSALRSTPSAPAEPPAPPLGADAVAASPASYRSSEIAVRGTIVERPTRISSRDRGAFVLAGRDGGRLLVVPADAAKLRNFRIGTTVTVDGRVVIPPDSKRLARSTASRTAIAERMGAPALIKAVEVRLAG
jgi:hypothetical protein